MRILNPRFDLETYFADVARARQRVLLLDYDGTLAPFHTRPERAVPYPGVAGLLSQIMRSRASRVIIVSGRGLEDLRRVLGFLRGAEAWGAHGWQHRAADGARTDFDPGGEALERLEVAAERSAPLLALGVRLERKSAALAAHWRGLDAATAREAQSFARELWPDLAGEALELLDFDGGIELRARGRNKGDVVLEALADGDGVAAAYLGDDLTDEDAFAAMRGRGLGALVSPQLRATRADLWLSPPRGLVEFLQRWHNATHGRSH
jgi:trehalose 6-phosphate phosphatase